MVVIGAEIPAGEVVRAPALTVHVVRHGQSTWNAAGRLQGQTAHPGLTDHGRAQAAAAARRLQQLLAGAAPGQVALQSSDLVRARETAELIGGLLGLRPAYDAALRERALGCLEGGSVREVHRCGDVDSGDPVGTCRHGAESFGAVAMRLRGWLAEVVPGAPRHLVVVSHGDTIAVLLDLLRGQAPREVDWEVPAHGAVASVDVPESRLALFSR